MHSEGDRILGYARVSEDGGSGGRYGLWLGVATFVMVWGSIAGFLNGHGARHPDLTRLSLYAGLAAPACCIAALISGVRGIAGESRYRRRAGWGLLMAGAAMLLEFFMFLLLCQVVITAI